MPELLKLKDKFLNHPITTTTGLTASVSGALAAHGFHPNVTGTVAAVALALLGVFAADAKSLADS